jgi:hypothetical protein
MGAIIKLFEPSSGPLHSGEVSSDRILNAGRYLEGEDDMISDSTQLVVCRRSKRMAS